LLLLQLESSSVFLSFENPPTMLQNTG